MSEPDKRIQELYTVPNVITVMRLLLVPVAFTVLVATDAYILAFLLFALAAGSDFLDGYIARATGTESEFGAMLDPLVDRLLLAAGVIGLYVLGRLPLWILICLLARDAYLLYGNVRLQNMGIESIRILAIGKAATLFLLFGFAGLILNWPRANGLGLVDASWLPGLNAEPYSIWIWIVYIGFILSMTGMVQYRVIAGMKKYRRDFESKTLPDPIVNK
jgi:cardiolipin synthase